MQSTVAAAAAATGKSTSTHTPPLMYSAVRFKTYFRKLKAKCVAHKYASIVMTGNDPITKFLKRQTEIRTELQTANLKIPTKDEIRDDPRKETHDFVKILEERLEFGLAAGNNTTVTAEKTDKLEMEVNNWIVGEGYIYELATTTLERQPGLIVGTYGAGRLQLKKLEDKHNLKAPETTETMIEVWDSLKIYPHELLYNFNDRFDERIQDMKLATPDAIIKNTSEIRYKYVKALERGGRFMEDLKTARRVGTNMQDLRVWLSKRENTQSLQILERHGLKFTDKMHNIPQEALAAVISNIEAKKKDGEKPMTMKSLCMYFCMYGKCKFGNKCKFIHPKWANGERQKVKGSNGDQAPPRGRDRKACKFKKPKREIECRFFKKGKCYKGNKCEYKHSKRQQAEALTFSDLVEKENAIDVEDHTEATEATAEIIMMEATANVEDVIATGSVVITPEVEPQIIDMTVLESDQETRSSRKQ